MSIEHLVVVHAPPEFEASGMSARVEAAVHVVLEMLTIGACEVGVELASAEIIQRLNRDFRGIDEVTDVLSFPMREGAPISSPVELARYLGDVAICVERAQGQANQYGHGLVREFCYLAVHGTLHLLGYDHESAEEKAVMRAAEEQVMAAFGEPEPVVGGNAEHHRSGD
jgi:probable rRNA maturation factor